MRFIFDRIRESLQNALERFCLKIKEALYMTRQAFIPER
jgi:hypothetical protein